MAITPIDTLPPAPNRADPATFSPRGDAFLGALVSTFTPQFNAAISAINSAQTSSDSDAATASVAASNAAAAAASAQQTASAAAWVGGNTYQQNVTVISQVTFQTYRKKTTAASSTGGVTDPANDTTNWALLVGGDANGAFLPVTMSTSNVDLSQGNYFIDTVNGARTYTFSNVPLTGYSFTLEVTLTSGSIAFPASVKAPSDVIPTLQTGKTHLFMFVTSNGGARWRMTVAQNYVT